MNPEVRLMKTLVETEIVGFTLMLGALKAA
jgi:hypothetical protein